jgi:hypothetical protein
MNGEFRRIRQRYLLAREQSIAPLFAAALANKREISRLAAEMDSLRAEAEAINGRLDVMPSVSSELYKMYAHHPGKTSAIGFCMSCNGLLVRGKIRPGEPATVYCASCKRTGMQQAHIVDIVIRCHSCRSNVPISWLVPVDGTQCSPFAIGICCDEPVIARLQIHKAETTGAATTGAATTGAATTGASTTGASTTGASTTGEDVWQWASDAETTAAAKQLPLLSKYRFTALGDTFSGPFMGGSKYPERSARCWGLGPFRLHDQLTTDATSVFLRNRVAKALVAAGADPEVARALLLAEPDPPRTDTAWETLRFEHPSHSRPSHSRAPLLDASTLRELSDKHGSAPEVAALAPGTIAILNAPGLSSDAFPARSARHHHSCHLRKGNTRMRPCNCEACSQSVRLLLNGLLVTTPLAFMNNRMTREEYESKMVKYSGYACAARESLIAVSVYTRLFERAVLPYTNDKITSAECVALLTVAHREITAFIDETRQYYEMT